MRYFDEEDCKKMNPPKWMIPLLQYNPDYCAWGNHEDYMIDDKSQWGSRLEFKCLPDFLNAFSPLNDLNEVVNFYFNISRSSSECSDCNGSGYNPETDKISNDWYNSDGEPEWIHITHNRRYNN